MNPILFAAGATTFTTNGLGRMADAISCTVEEERNGVYELEMKYPIDGIHFSDLALEMILYSRHCDALDLQPFRIYRITKPLNGVVTVNARHISYDLNKIVVKAFDAAAIGEAFLAFPLKAINSCPFTFITDKTTSGNFKVSVPSSIRSVLGGVEGSILDVYGGGEYEWDHFTVKLHSARGTASGVTVRYGKNLTDMTHINDSEDQYDGVAPFWESEDTTVVLPEGAIYKTGASGTRVVPLDLSQDFQNAPTVAQLRNKATSYLNSTDNTTPDENIKISFVQLWQTEEYKDYAPLQRVKLCDTVDVIYNKLGVKVSAKVIKVVYNVLLERYDEMELGDPRKSLVTTLANQAAATERAEKIAASAATVNDVAAAIEANSEKITGALGGYVVIEPNPSTGYPERILVMDTADTSTAQNVVQINKNGIGFSQTGINGPYSTAWSIDGSFTATFISTWRLSAAQITSGTMSAARILGGTLKIGGTASGTGGNGIIDIYNSSNTRVGRWNVDGLTVGSHFAVDMSGNITASGGTIGGFTIGASSLRNGMTSRDDTGNNGVWVGTNGIALGAGKFKVTSAGALTSTSGRIGNWRIGTNAISSYPDMASGTAGTQYQVQLQSQASITGDDWAIDVRSRSWNGSSYGSWVAHLVIKYDGTMMLSAAPETGYVINGTALTNGTVERQFTFDNGRFVLYRNETLSGTKTSYWTGFIDSGLYSQDSSTHTRYMGLITYRTNVVGFGTVASSSLSSTKTLVFFYDGLVKSATNDYGVMVSNRDLYMQQNRIENASRVQITGYGYAVSGLSRTISGNDALFQISYAQSYSFIYLNGNQVSSIPPSSSDRNKKKYIKPIDSDLVDRIGSVELKQFRYKAEMNFGDETHFGAIAQDVQEALGDVNSNMVFTAPGSEDLNLNYTEFLILRLAAAEKRIAALESREVTQ